MADFISIIAGGIIGVASTLYFASRKEKNDRATVQGQKTAEYHTTRKEQLARVIAYVQEVRALFDDARKNTLGAQAHSERRNKTSDLPERINDQIARGYELVTRAMTEAELYGDLPYQCKVSRKKLLDHVDAVLNMKVKGLFSPHAHYMEVQDYIGHAMLFVDDLRVLMNVEESLARDALNCTYNAVAPSLPYLERNSTVLPATSRTIGDLDWTHFDNWERRK